MKYRSKPVIKEAIQWTGKNYEAVMNFTSDKLGIIKPWHDRSFLIPTLEGEMRADLGDYIIKGLKGEFYPCKPDIFEMTYEKVEQHGSEDA